MKTFFLTTLIIFHLIAISAFAQIYTKGENLVENPSFELTDSCLGYSNSVFYLKNWRHINNTLPMYYNACAPRPDETPLGLSLNVPYTNTMDYIQYAHTGHAFIELGIRFHDNTIKYASYIETKLKHTLIRDSVYCIELFSNLPDYSLVDETAYTTLLFKYFTTLFTESTIDSNQNLDDHYYPYEPSVRLYADNKEYIEDTVKWIKMSGSYLASGKEKILTLGAFNIPYYDLKVAVVNHPIQRVGSIFIDDVAVYKGKCREEEKPQKTFFNLYPNPGSGVFSLNYGMAQDARLVVYDILGRTVLNETLAADKVLHHFIMQQYSNGMYFLKVLGANNDEELFSQKFLLQR
ncbi:MAG: T9SS type A sorting domain-containing protein [Bacteroidota bacterium]|jgi:hypothetical protein